MNKYDESYLSGLIEDQKKKEQKRMRLNSTSLPSKKKKVNQLLAKLTFLCGLCSEILFIFSGNAFISLWGASVLKKGAFKRGKIGFLNNSELIKVLATHHLGNKKSLMIVQAVNKFSYFLEAIKG